MLWRSTYSVLRLQLCPEHLIRPVRKIIFGLMNASELLLRGVSGQLRMVIIVSISTDTNISSSFGRGRPQHTEVSPKWQMRCTTLTILISRLPPDCSLETAVDNYQRIFELPINKLILEGTAQ